MNPNLEIAYKSKYKDEQYLKDKEKRREDKRKQREEQTQKDANEPRPVKKIEELKRRHSSVDSQRSGSPKPSSKSVLKERKLQSDDDSDSHKTKKKKRQLSDPESEDAWEPSAKNHKSKEPKTSSKKSSAKTSKSSSAKGGSSYRRKRGRKASGSGSDNDAFFWNSTANLSGSRHCYGHKCKKEAREGSKYCSDNCGINLASLRIMQTLPDRIREWNMMPCEAEKRNRRELESIRAKQEAVKVTLEQLNRDFRTLEELIAKGKSQVIEEKGDSDDEDDTTAGEMTVHCVTCGADVQTLFYLLKYETKSAVARKSNQLQ